jgi:hypothetical protein
MLHLSTQKKKKKKKMKKGKEQVAQNQQSAMIKAPTLWAHKRNKGVCHTVALPFTFKSILRQKKNYGKLKYFTIQK